MTTEDSADLLVSHGGAAACNDASHHEALDHGTAPGVATLAERLRCSWKAGFHLNEARLGRRGIESLHQHGGD